MGNLDDILDEIFNGDENSDVFSTPFSGAQTKLKGKNSDGVKPFNGKGRVLCNELQCCRGSTTVVELDENGKVVKKKVVKK